jgi:hypothetical protein
MDPFDKTAIETYKFFNDFMKCDDTKIFGKLVARTILLNSVKNIPGDIVECGVFKGTGMLSFLKLKKLLFPNSIKRVIGFDFFETNELVGLLHGNDKRQVQNLFEERDFSHRLGSVDDIHNMIKKAGFSEVDFELVTGDIRQTAYDFAIQRPGFKISMLYMDLDLEHPTFCTLDAFWDRVSKGGIVVFDEYAYHRWSEDVGVDRFFTNKNVVIKTLNFLCPTAYVIK